MTSRVVKPRCTRTLSITTWKNNGVINANSCSAKLTASTSPSSRRYFTIAGMNQVKSNFASSPATDAFDAIRMSSPDQRRSNSSRSSVSGRPTRGSWMRTRPSSIRAKMKNRTAPSSVRALAIAGNGVVASLDIDTDTDFARTPSFLDANRMSATPKNPPSPNSCRSWSGSTGSPWNLAMMTRQVNPESGA